ncbi:hypothetical protein PVAP13_7KG286500 [Panicum virgatum]|uniref:Uncharacterized protein n=1 Tax=Panicum virgatum TaxID=38727 RepID=A0A8T0QP60_PANVG|nr:hypothetical protein PVAP13_7KG286500 [Panicum virgatum]
MAEAMAVEMRNKAAACSIEPAAKEAKAKADGTVMKSVMIPDAYIKKLQARPPRRPFSRLSEDILQKYPELRAITAKADAEMQALIKMEEDIINQYRTKGHAIVQVKEDVLNWCRAKGYTFVEV